MSNDFHPGDAKVAERFFASVQSFKGSVFTPTADQTKLAPESRKKFTL
jgi:hypothetical protein